MIPGILVIVMQQIETVFEHILIAQFSFSFNELRKSPNFNRKPAN